MGSPNEVRSTYTELIESHRYTEMDDSVVFARMDYWKLQRDAAEHPRRIAGEIQTIVLRLAAEVLSRVNEERLLEAQVALEYIPIVEQAAA